FVIGKEKIARAFAVKLVITKPAMTGLNGEAMACQVRTGPEGRQPVVTSPGPSIPEPERRQDVKIGGIRAAIRCRHADKQVIGIHLGVFERNIEVAALAQDARIPEFKIRSLLRPAMICRNEL